MLSLIIKMTYFDPERIMLFVSYLNQYISEHFQFHFQFQEVIFAKLLTVVLTLLLFITASIEICTFVENLFSTGNMKED